MKFLVQHMPRNLSRASRLVTRHGWVLRFRILTGFDPIGCDEYLTVLSQVSESGDKSIGPAQNQTGAHLRMGHFS